MNIYTAKDIAKIYNISERRIRAIAAKRGIGQKVGKWGMWVFQKSDIPKLKPGDPWRPKGK